MCDTPSPATPSCVPRRSETVGADEQTTGIHQTGRRKADTDKRRHGDTDGESMASGLMPGFSTSRPHEQAIACVRLQLCVPLPSTSASSAAGSDKILNTPENNGACPSPALWSPRLPLKTSQRRHTNSESAGTAPAKYIKRLPVDGFLQYSGHGLIISFTKAVASLIFAAACHDCNRNVFTSLLLPFERCHLLHHRIALVADRNFDIEGATCVTFPEFQSIEKDSAVLDRGPRMVCTTPSESKMPRGVSSACMITIPAKIITDVSRQLIPKPFL